MNTLGITIGDKLFSFRAPEGKPIRIIMVMQELVSPNLSNLSLNLNLHHRSLMLTSNSNLLKLRELQWNR